MTRYNKLLYRNEIIKSTRELENINISQDERKNLCDKSKEIIDQFNNFRINSESPSEILEKIKNPTCIAGEILITIFSKMLKINIVILSAWSDNVSVEKIYNYSDDSPYIFLFLTKPGPIGLKGTHNYGHFEAGAIMDEKGDLLNIIYPGKNEDIIYILKNYSKTNNLMILRNNYNKYLEMNKNKITEEEYNKSKQNLEKVTLYPSENALDEILIDSIDDNRDIKDILDNLELN